MTGTTSKCRALSLACSLLVSLGASAEAGWREDLGTFRIGMLADPGAGRSIAGLSDIQQAYSTALGMPVQIFVARDYAALIDAHATSRIEYAVYSAMAFATAQRLCGCVEPVVARRGPDQDIGMRAVLLLRTPVAEGEAAVGDLKITITRGDSIASAAIPSMIQAGAIDLSDITSEQFVVASSESEAEVLLLNREVDGMFGWIPAGENPEAIPEGGTIERLQAAGVDVAELNVHWMSDLLRYGPHAIRTGIDDEAKQLLVTFLSDLSRKKPDIQELLTGSPFGSFVPVTAADYKLAQDIVSEIDN